MANNPYVNKVIYGNDTIIDLTGDTVTPADVASGKTFHDASGTAQAGSYVAPTITDITPSNENPVRLTIGNNYKMLNLGYAIQTYIQTSPSDISPINIIAGNIYKMRSNGYAVQSITTVRSSDSNPPRLLSGNNYHVPPEAGVAGYLYTTQRVGPAYTKAGTLPDFTAANQEQTVDTGLSNITYFYVEGIAKNYSNIRHKAWLDLTITDGAKQVAVQTSTTAATSSATSSGTDANGIITANNNFLKVSGISGGIVTIKGSNSAAYAEQNVKWYAG